MNMKRLIVSVIAFAVLSSLAAYAEEQQKSPEAESPVKTEMRLLNAAFINLIDSLVLNNPQAIEEPFHEVHKAKANTEEALKKGELRLPKNGDKIKQFVRMDEQFHRKTEAMLAAARKGNMRMVQNMTHKLLNGCVQCHRMFRN